jgi:hypothetical protein
MWLTKLLTCYNKKRQLIFIVGLIIILTVGLSSFIVATYKNGPVLVTDSAVYLSVAENSRAGKGLIGFDGTPLILQPPGYSFLLLFMELVTQWGLKQSGWLINLITYALMIGITSVYICKRLKFSITLSLLGIGLLCFNSSILHLYISLLSEGVFIFGGLLFMILIGEIGEKRSVYLLILAALLASLLSMIRYSGVIYILSGIIFLYITGNKTILCKTLTCLVWGCLAIIPLSAWCIRNYSLSGSLFGLRHSSSYAMIDLLKLTYKTINSWFPQATLLLIFSFIIIFLIIYSYKPFGMFLKKNFLLFPCIFTVCYIIFIIYSSYSKAYDPINNRLLSPIYIPLLIISLSFINTFCSSFLYFDTSYGKRKLIALCILFLVLIQPAYSFSKDVLFLSNNSAGGFESRNHEEEMSLYALARFEFDNNVAIYSNDPERIYLLANVDSALIPETHYYNSPDPTESLSDLKGHWPKNNHAYLVWIKQENPNLLRINEISQICTLNSLVDLPYLTIYQIDAYLNN